MASLGTWLIQVLGFAATAGVISGVLTHFLNQREAREQRQSASAYVAIRLAVVFEHFADDCTDVLQWNENVESSHGATGESRTTIPDLATFPSDEDGWKALAPGLVNEALSFHQRIKMAKSIVQSGFDYAEYSDALQEANEQMVLLGARAWYLAVRLRTSYGFAPLGLEFPFHEHLIARLPAVRARRIAIGSREGAIDAPSL